MSRSRDRFINMVLASIEPSRVHIQVHVLHLKIGLHQPVT